MTLQTPVIFRVQTEGSDLSLKGVGVDIEGRQILRDVTFSSRAARIGVVGRNGSGKSTLARIIAGLLPVKSGTVLINGLNIARDRKAALREVGILFQNPDHQIIFPTVLEEVAFGLRQLALPKVDANRKASDTLTVFGKAHWADAPIAALSQGQKHLVCLMSIVAMRPKMIVLDEPFSGLDIPTKLQLKTYLRRYDGGLVHVSHDPADLTDYEHVLWLENGELLDEGSSETLLPKYSAEMTRLGASDDISDLSN